jgi:hypothetical protein
LDAALALLRRRGGGEDDDGGSGGEGNSSTSTSTSTSSTTSTSTSSTSSSSNDATDSSDHLDAVLLTDVIYGSDPGAWEALAATLRAAAGPRTLVAQAETRRLEGVLYDEVGVCEGRVCVVGGVWVCAAFD